MPPFWQGCDAQSSVSIRKPGKGLRGHRLTNSWSDIKINDSVFYTTNFSINNIIYYNEVLNNNDRA